MKFCSFKILFYILNISLSVSATSQRALLCTTSSAAYPTSHMEHCFVMCYHMLETPAIIAKNANPPIPATKSNGVKSKSSSSEINTAAKPAKRNVQIAISRNRKLESIPTISQRAMKIASPLFENPLDWLLSARIGFLVGCVTMMDNQAQVVYASDLIASSWTRFTTQEVGGWRFGVWRAQGSSQQPTGKCVPTVPGMVHGIAVFFLPS